MKQFICKTWSKEHGIVSKNIWGESQEEIVLKAKKQDLMIISLIEVKKKNEYSKWKIEQVIEFSHKMRLLLEAGISLRRIMEIVVNQRSQNIPYEAMYEGIQRGRSLSSILKELQFPSIGQVLIESGERSGTLGETLKILEDYYISEKKWKKQLQSALAYPIFLLIVLCLFIGAAIGFILPQFKRVFTTMNVEVPSITKLLFSLGDIISQYGLYVLAGNICFCVLTVYLYKQKKFRYHIHKWIWIQGIHFEWMQSFFLSRQLKVWSILLNSGLTLLDCLSLTSSLWGNYYASHCQDKVMESIRQGYHFTTALEEHTLGTPFVWDLLKIGEETGELVRMLQHGADYYTSVLEHYVHRMEQLLEPIMITCMGIIVAVLVISVMIPMFNAVTAVQNI